MCLVATPFPRAHKHHPAVLAPASTERYVGTLDSRTVETAVLYRGEKPGHITLPSRLFVIHVMATFIQVAPERRRPFDWRAARQLSIV